MQFVFPQVFIPSVQHGKYLAQLWSQNFKQIAGIRQSMKRNQAYFASAGFAVEGDMELFVFFESSMTGE